MLCMQIDSTVLHCTVHTSLVAVEEVNCSTIDTRVEDMLQRARRRFMHGMGFEG
jgi:hypothetical protein